MDNEHTHENFTLVQGLTRLHQLIQQYDGWCSDYIGGDESAALLIVGHLTRTILANGESAPGKVLLNACVHAICESELTHWSAFDPASKAQWNPLVQSYKTFQQQFPAAEPYVASSQSASWPSRVAKYLCHQ